MTDDERDIKRCIEQGRHIYAKYLKFRRSGRLDLAAEYVANIPRSEFQLFIRMKDLHHKKLVNM